MPIRIGTFIRSTCDVLTCFGPGKLVIVRGRQEAAAPQRVLAIALANKLARIAWSVLARGRNFEARTITEATAETA